MFKVKITQILLLKISVLLFFLSFINIISATEQPFTLISSNNINFKVPFKIVKQSKVCSEHASSRLLKIQIDSEILVILINAMNLLFKYKNIENQKTVYENIHFQLPIENTQKSINKIVNLFINASKLDFELLENIFADKLAQLLLNSDKTLNIENLNSIVNLFDNNSFFLRKSWYLIEKFYYLRLQELKPNINNLLLNFNSQLKTYFSVNLNNLADIGKIIFLKMKLSINDLIDYKAINSNAGKLNFNNFYITNLNGMQRINNINSVISIDLSNNNIYSLSNNFKNLHNLKSLNLKNNKIGILENSLDDLINLIYLNLNNNQIAFIKGSFNNLKNLKKLILSNNEIKKLENSFNNLSNLEFLNLSNNRITKLSNSLENLQQLKYLNLENNFIAELNDSLQNLQNLKYLNLNNNRLVKLPAELKQLNNLQYLYLNQNQLTDLTIILPINAKLTATDNQLNHKSKSFLQK